MCINLFGGGVTIHPVRIIAISIEAPIFTMILGIILVIPVIYGSITFEKASKIVKEAKKFGQTTMSTLKEDSKLKDRDIFVEEDSNPITG